MTRPPEIPPGSIAARTVLRLDAHGAARRAPDRLAVEAPLAIRVNGAPLATTMRTPGHDEELVAGFLATEGVVRARTDVVRMDLHDDRAEVTLAPSIAFAAEAHARRVVATSACGACARPTIDVRADVPAVGAGGLRIDRRVLAAMPDALRAAQAMFAASGGTHAAGLFDAEGALRCLREDVGRHNAVDKVVGRLLLDDALPVAAHVLLVSGRASFEIVQKAARAGIPVVAAVSAASDLAADCAERAGITLVAFLRDGGAAIMSRPERIRP